MLLAKPMRECVFETEKFLTLISLQSVQNRTKTLAVAVQVETPPREE